MTIFVNIIVMLLGIVLLVRCADWFTDASVEIARRFRIPELLIGATLVSLATTLPEFAVSVLATCRGNVEMAVGNAVGSTICNIGLILGLCVILAPMSVDVVELRRNGLSLLAILVLFIILDAVFYPGGSRWVGVAMIACLCVYGGLSIRATLASRGEGPITRSDTSPEMSGTRIVWCFVGGAAGVLLGSKLVVDRAEVIARAAGVSDLFIALTLVALGTSTPELVISLAALVKRQRALSLGNLIGANIMNLAWVAGACSLIRPLQFERQTLLFDLPVTLLLSLLLLVFGLTGRRLARLEGAVLLVIYVAYLTVLATVFRAA